MIPCFRPKHWAKKTLSTQWSSFEDIGDFPVAEDEEILGYLIPESWSETALLLTSLGLHLNPQKASHSFYPYQTIRGSSCPKDKRSRLVAITLDSGEELALRCSCPYELHTFLTKVGVFLADQEGWTFNAGSWGNLNPNL